MDGISAFYASSCVAHQSETNSGLVKMFLRMETGDQRPHEVTSLDFSSLYMGSRGIAALCHTLTSLRHLQHVSFADMRLEADAHGSIANFAENHPTLTSVDVSGKSNPVFATGGRRYASMLKKNPKIVKLWLNSDEMPGRIETQIRVALGRNISLSFPVDLLSFPNQTSNSKGLRNNCFLADEKINPTLLKQNTIKVKSTGEQDDEVEFVVTRVPVTPSAIKAPEDQSEAAEVTTAAPQDSATPPPTAATNEASGGDTPSTPLDQHISTTTTQQADEVIVSTVKKTKRKKTATQIRESKRLEEQEQELFYGKDQLQEVLATAETQAERTLLESILADDLLQKRFLDLYLCTGTWVCQLVSDFGVHVLREDLLQECPATKLAASTSYSPSTTSPLQQPEDDLPLFLRSMDSLLSGLVADSVEPLRKRNWTESLKELISSLQHPSEDGGSCRPAKPGQLAPNTGVPLPSESGKVLEEQMDRIEELLEETGLVRTSHTLEGLNRDPAVVLGEITTFLTHCRRRLGMCNPDLELCTHLRASEEASDDVETQMVDHLYSKNRSLLLLRDEMRYLQKDYPAEFRNESMVFIKEEEIEEEEVRPVVSSESKGVEPQDSLEVTKNSSNLGETSNNSITTATENDAAPMSTTSRKATTATVIRRRAEKKESSLNTKSSPAAEVRRRYAQCCPPHRKDLASALREVLVSMRLSAPKTATGLDTTREDCYAIQRRRLFNRLIQSAPPRFMSFLVSLHLERCFTKCMKRYYIEGTRKTATQLHKSELLSAVCSKAAIDFSDSEVCDSGDPFDVICSLGSARDVAQCCRQAAAWWRLRVLLG